MSQIVANIVVQDKIAQTIDGKLDRIAKLSVEAAKGIAALNSALKETRVGNLTEITKQLNTLRGLKIPTMGKISVGTEGISTASGQINDVIGKTKALADVKTKLDAVEKKAASSAQQYNNQIVRLTKSINGYVNVADRGASILQKFAGAITAHQVFQATETYNQLTNRLTLVTSSIDEARGRFSSLAAAARESYSDIHGMVTLYTRLDLAMRQIGGTSQEAVLVTKTLSKAVSLAGLTTGEAASAMLQISQAFNKGKLDGDEFRSVMENMPLVMDAIAKKMGVTRGELLKLAPEGKITAQVMKEAILEAMTDIDEAFTKIQPTVGQMFTNLQTSAVEYFGLLNKNLGVTNAIGAGFELIANNIDKVVVAMGILTASFAAAGVVKWISGAAALFAQLRAAMVASAAATTAMGTAAVGTASKFSALNAVMAANPVFRIGALIATVTTLVIGLAESFGLLDIFGTFSQDMQKANDYVTRIDEIRERKELASKTELFKESENAQNAIDAMTAKIEQQREAYAKAAQEAQRWATAKEAGIKRVGNALSQVTGLIEHMTTVDSEAAKASEMHAKAKAELEKILVDTKNTYESQIEVLEEANQRIQDQIDAVEQQIAVTKAAGVPIDNLQAKLGELQSEFAATASRIAYARAQLVAFLQQAAMGGTVNIGANLVNVATSIADTEKARQYDKALVATQKNLMEVEKQQEVVRKKGLSHAEKTAEINKKAAAFAKEQADMAKLVGTNEKKVKEIYDQKHKAQQDKLMEEYKASEGDGVKKKGGGKKGGGGKSRKEQLTDEQKELKKATESWKTYNENLKSEQALLEQGFDAYTKYRSLYEEVNKARVAGVKIQDEEIERLKQLIDLNERNKKIMSYAEDYKNNSYQSREDDFNMRVQGLQTAKLDDKDKPRAVNDTLGSLGLDTTGTKTYYQQILEDAEFTWARIHELEKQNLIDSQQSFAMRAQVWSKSQEQMVKPVSDMFGTIAQLQNSENKKLAKIGKGAAIAQAMMNTYTGATAAYASAAAIPYVGYAIAPVVAAAAVAAGLANVANIRSQGTGYYGGGYTGSGNPRDFAGWTHKNEYVFDHKSTSDLGVNNLQALRNGSAEIVQKGEMMNGGRGVNVDIQNYGTNKNFDVQQIDENNIRIIVTDVLQSTGNTLVKSYMQSVEGRELIGKTAKRENG